MDSWVPENNISDNLIKDFKAGIEYAPQDKVYTPPTYAPSGIKMKTKSATLVKVFAGLSFFRCRSPLLCDLAVGRWCTAKLGSSDLIANMIVNSYLTSAALIISQAKRSVQGQGREKIIAGTLRHVV